jgi:hypothetical protein
MSTLTNTFKAVFDYLGDPITLEEFEVLGLPESTMQRLAHLLEVEAAGMLSPTEAAQLEAFREAAFYMRMGHREQP